MAYFKNLLPNEEELLRSRKSTIILLDTVLLTIIGIAIAIFVYAYAAPRWLADQPAVLVAFLAFAFLVIAVLLLINDIIGFMEMELVVTNMRVLGKTGIVALSVMDVPINRITDLRLDMSMFGTMFDYGTLTFHTPNGIFEYKKINNPIKIKNTINNVLHGN